MVAGALVAAAGCGPEFSLLTATSSTSGTGGSGGGTTSSGSTGGGGGGLPAKCTVDNLATCAAGSYCQKSSGQCVSCADISAAFSFGTTRKLNLDLPNMGSAPSFVRLGKDGQLLFAYRDEMSQDIGHAAPDPKEILKWGAGVAEAYPVNTGGDESSPFYLPKAKLLAGLVKQDFPTDGDAVIYTSTVTTKRRVYAFVPGMTPPSSDVDLKATGASLSNLTVAFDAANPRFWFGNNTSPTDLNTEQIFTSLPGEAPTQVSITLDNGCPLTTPGVAPWVTPDGRWLLFGAPRPDDGCGGQSSPQFHLFYVELGDDGQPKAGANAKEILKNNSQNAVRPSLSPDRCILFFSELDTTTQPALWSSYAAFRQ